MDASVRVAQSRIRACRAVISDNNNRIHALRSAALSTLPRQNTYALLELDELRRRLNSAEDELREKATTIQLYEQNGNFSRCLEFFRQRGADQVCKEMLQTLQTELETCQRQNAVLSSQKQSEGKGKFSISE